MGGHFSMDSLQAEYEATHYLDASFPHAHPGVLSAVGSLFGMTPAPLEKCRVLELGCACGTNLLPLAELLPGSEFVGVDICHGHIAQAQCLADAADLHNVALHAGDLLDFDPGPAKFDYIIAHGVYSWVPDDVKTALLALCCRALAPQGIAYISYNTYPGWSLRKPLCDTLKLKMNAAQGFGPRIAAAREMADFLDDALRPVSGPYAVLVRDLIAAMRERNANNCYYDEIAPVNDPCYFLNFMEQAEKHRLQYLGDSCFSSMFHESYSIDPGGKLGRMGLGYLQKEQLIDFVRNRSFRMTLLCREGVALQRAIAPENVRGLRVRSMLKMPAGAVDLRPGVQAAFNGDCGMNIASSEPWTKAFLSFLTERAPRFVPWEAAAAHATSVTAEHTPAEKRAGILADSLTLTLYCLAQDLMRASAFGLDPPTEAPLRPRATRLAREQGRRGPNVTNLLHDWCTLADCHRETLSLMDGTHPRESFVAADLQALLAMSLVLPDTAITA
jgi:SAM-dependent methyltransferase